MTAEKDRVAFDDGKDADALRTIGELARAIGLKQHVLRYWEQQFPMLQPLKRSGGRRYYRPGDVAMVFTIDRLVNREGYTLKGARQAIEGGRSEVPAPSPVVTASVAAMGAGQPAASGELISELKAIRNRLAKALQAA